MKNSLFNPEGWLWKPFGKVTDILILSALWLFTCLPIVTIGSAFTALYDCSARCVKTGNSGMISRYFRTFRRELLPGFISFLLWVIIISVLFFSLQIFPADSTTFNLIVTYAAIFLLVFVIGIASWVLPLLSRFTFNFVDLNLTAFRLAIANLPRTMVLGICTFLTVWICLRLWIPLIIAPGVYGIICAYILEPVFKRYEDKEISMNEN